MAIKRPENYSDGRKKYNGAKKGRNTIEVKQLLEQAKIDGNKMQVKIWQSVLDKLDGKGLDGNNK